LQFHLAYLLSERKSGPREFHYRVHKVERKYIIEKQKEGYRAFPHYRKLQELTTSEFQRLLNE